MRCIADVNVLLPVLAEGHGHRPAALAWWEAQMDGDVGLCLPVRMGLLRLLTNIRVMGASVQRPEAAWSVLEMLRADPRIVDCVTLPATHDALWRTHVSGREPSPNIWTDAWLASAAQSLNLELVTFDRGFLAFADLQLNLLAA